MPDDDAKLTIQIKTEADTAAIDKAAGALKGVKEAAGEAVEETGKLSEGGHKLVQQFGSLRSAGHALRAIKDLSEGGTEAIAGTAGAVRFLGEAFEGLLPGLGPIIIAISTITDLAVTMVAKQQEHVEKTEDSQKAEEELAKGSEDAAKNRIDAIERIIQAAADQIASYKQINEELERQEKYNQTAIADSEKLITAQKNLAVATLESQRQVELGRATSPEQTSAINKKYRNLIEQTNASSESKIADLKIEASADEIAAKEGEQRRVNEELRGLTPESDKYQDRANTTAATAQSLGVEADGAGSYGKAQEDLRKEFARVGAAYKKNPVPELNDQLQEVGGKLNAANNAEDARQALEKWNKEVGEKAQALSLQFEELGATIKQLRDENQVLQIDQKTALVKESTARETTRQSDTESRAKELYDLQKQTLENQKKDLETAAENPNLTPQQKSALKQQSLGVSANLSQLQIDNAGTLKLSQSAVSGLRDDVKNDRSRATFAGESNEKKDLQQAVSEHIQVASKLVGDTKDAGLIEALKAITSKIAQQNPQAELTGVLRELVGALSITHNAAQSTAIQAEIKALQENVRSLTKGNNN